VASPLHYLDDPQTWERERDAFVQAAVTLMAETGTVEVQVGHVVRAAGRHNAAFYRVFGSKEGLQLAVVESAVRRTVAALQRRMSAAGSPAEAVRAWARLLLGLAAGDATSGAHAIALDRYRLLRRFPDAEATISDPLRDLLAAVLTQAGVRPATTLAEAALELVLSRQASWIAVGRRPTDREIRVYADLAVRLVGLAPVTDLTTTDRSLRT
jgi:AcrR family transcriptional regulator